MSRTAATGPGEKYITPDEAAREIGRVSPVTIKKYCREGMFPGAFIFSHAVGWRIPRNSWERFKRERQSEAQP